MVKKPRPGVLATKAVNQYRSRDAFAYLGLRHLLKGPVSRTDEWANTVAVDQIIRRGAASYFVSDHFKERDKSGNIEFRRIAVPGPVEILAETALLTECARHESLATRQPVFTYHLTRHAERSGVFKNYMIGLRARHKAIELECSRQPSAIVKFIDIKKFYPSLRTIDLQAAWRKHTNILDATWRELGERLIADHQAFSIDGSKGLLTGPMFSHFMANLVMRDLDLWAVSELKAKYFRYVDDITLVGNATEVREAERKIAERLSLFELELHPENSMKSIEVSTSDWLVGKSDFEHNIGDVTWGKLVSDIKNFLTVNPDKAEELSRAIASDGGRLPVFDYSLAIKEARHSASFLERVRFAWFRRSVSDLSVNVIAQTAKSLKRKMEEEVGPMLAELPNATGFARKRLVPKLRFRIGRLAYLSEESVLQMFSSAASGVEELDLQTEAIEATTSGDISSLVSMGSNAVQAALQPLKASGKQVSATLRKAGVVEMQGLATAALNGVHVEITNPDYKRDEILELCMSHDIQRLRRSESRFISELALLTGKDGSHLPILAQAFDEEEQITLDAVERFEESAPLDI